ncbi:MAG: FAD-binding oxidoreductase, partial [Dehalococcoidia bacterium]
MPMKWWGWGEEGRSFSLAAPEQFWSFVGKRLGGSGVSPRLDSPQQIVLRPCRLSAEHLAALRRSIGDPYVSVDTVERAVHSLGKGYRDLVRMRRGEITEPTDAVVYPHTEEAVAAVLEAAAERGFAVVPFGGGTSVVGGVEPVAGSAAIALDLSRMDRVLQVDRVSATATVEAGILGPALEAQLNAAGFTLGHFPQSFEYSSLGGWIATRSAGQNSTLYGKIEERVESTRILFPGGALTTNAVPAAAAGPDFNQVIAGSEGVLGVITQATVRVTPLPERTDYRGYLIPSFEAGVEAAREMLQAGLRPSVLRLSDEPESEATAIMSVGAEGMNAALLILGFDGAEDEVSCCWER